MRIQAQLDELAARLGRAQQELEVASEQVAFQSGVVDEAQVRRVVAGTPLADREYREAWEDLERLKRYYEQVRESIAELNAERDRLLDRLLEGMDPEPTRGPRP